MRDHSASVAPDQNHEFELVLGNKQLFSVLFIVFVLLGVFFAMGYVMGRNSAPIESTTARRAESASDAAISTAGRRSTIENSAPTTQPDTTKQAEKEVETPAAAERASSPPATVVDTEQAATTSVVEPKPGQTFLQVSAVAKPEAELLVEVLIKKGFHAIVAPGPSEKFYRVLVGPAKDDADLGKTRTELEQAGFRPIPRRY